MLHISEVRTKANVERIVESGLVEATGNGKARSYMLSLQVYKEQDNTIGYVRQTGINALKHEALILELASKQNGYITRDNVVELLGMTTSQAYRILKKMADKGKLVLEGTGRASRYKAV